MFRPYAFERSRQLRTVVRPNGDLNSPVGHYGLTSSPGPDRRDPPVGSMAIEQVTCPTTESQISVDLRVLGVPGPNEFICPACSRMHEVHALDRTVTDFGPLPRGALLSRSSHSR